MQSGPINENVTEDDLFQTLEAIKNINLKFNKLGTDIFKNETEKKILTKTSHFIFSIIHRAIELNRGFWDLAESKNWITAINLIRLQADNCMRIYALTISEDKLEFYNKVVDGESIRNLKDVRGKKMTDSYLSKELDKILPGFRLLYENTSEYVHFTGQHIKFNNDVKYFERDFLMYIRLSEPTKFSIAQEVDYAFNMFLVSKDLFKLINVYKINMEKALGD